MPTGGTGGVECRRDIQRLEVLQRAVRPRLDLRGLDAREVRRELLALALMLAGATSVACFWVSSVSDHLMFRLILAAAVLATSLTSTAFLALGCERDPGFGASRIPRKPRRFGDGKALRWMAWAAFLCSTCVLLLVAMIVVNVVYRL